MAAGEGTGERPPAASRRRLLVAGAAAIVGIAALDSLRRGGVLARPDGPINVQSRAGTAYVPPLSGDNWETVSPASAGWDEARLNEALAYAGENQSTAMVVLYRGRIMAERYWRDWNLHSAAAIASCQKSVTSLLTGIAQEEGLLRIDDPVSHYLGAGWTKAPPEAEERITLRHLLTMTSGLADDLSYEVDAGTRWYYNTPAYYRLKAVIERAAGVSMNDFTRTRLLERIGMQDSVWFGELLAPPPGQQLRSSARNMARFGLLILNDGNWGAEAIIGDTQYLAESVTTSQELNLSYGYLWWLNGQPSHVLPGPARQTREGPFIPAAPSDMVSALGVGDKKIYLVKSMDLVVTRHGAAAGMGRTEAVSSFDNLLWQKLMAAAP